MVHRGPRGRFEVEASQAAALLKLARVEVCLLEVAAACQQVMVVELALRKEKVGVPILLLLEQVAAALPV
jgi:hypothetical protein